MISSISWIDVNQNFCALASARPVLMPQSHFLSLETTIAKDARVQIRNNIVEFIAMVQSQNWEGRVMRAFFSWRQLALFGYPK